MDQQEETQQFNNNNNNNGYVFNGQILLLAAIITVFAFVVLLVTLHLYAKWYLRRSLSRRRTHVVVVAAGDHHPSPGLEPTVIKSLPVFTFRSSAAATAAEPPLECAVCLSEFEEEEVVRLLPKCNHSFHIECIDMWFYSHSTCPLCRAAVEPAENRVEPDVNRDEPVEPVGEVSGSEPGSSSECEMCGACQHENNGATSLGVRRKAVDVKIEVGPPLNRRFEFDSELPQSLPSPMNRLLSFKRLLSMGRKSPAGGESSRAAAELDLESGLGEPVRVDTPKTK